MMALVSILNQQNQSVSARNEYSKSYFCPRKSVPVKGQIHLSQDGFCYFVGGIFILRPRLGCHSLLDRVFSVGAIRVPRDAAVLFPGCCGVSPAGNGAHVFLLGSIARNRENLPATYVFPSVSISHNRDLSQAHLLAGKSRNELQCLFSVLFDNRNNGRGCDHLTGQGLLRVRFVAIFHRLTAILRWLYSVAGTIRKNSDAKRACLSTA
jgi:hypothetical protein